MARLPLIVIFRGGYSGESVISHQSAATMMAAVDRSGHRAFFVSITKEAWTAEDDQERPLALDKGDLSVDLGHGSERPVAAMIAIHGAPGEDGRLQGYLDMLGIPYQTGSVLNMALTFSKFSTVGLLRELGFAVPRSVLVTRDGPQDQERVLTHTGLPCFVKPDEAGSSLGVTKVKTADALDAALVAAFAECPRVLVESAVAGRELTCGVLTLEGTTRALPICEVRTSREFFDFEAKYHATDTEEIVPADLPDEVARLVQERSVAIYKALDCRGMVRVDHFWTGERLLTIEVNTVPGFSKASIFPKMLRADGIGVEGAINAMLRQLVHR